MLRSLDLKLKSCFLSFFKMISELFHSFLFRSNLFNSILVQTLFPKTIQYFNYNCKFIKIQNSESMLGDNLDINVIKYGVMCIFSVLALIVIFIIKLITGSYIAGILIFVVLIWLLIFKIGITIMYPGSSNYFTADIQMRIGNEVAKNFNHLGHCFQYLGECIVQKKVQFTASQWNLKEKILGNIHTSIQMLSMFQHNLSERKSKILQILRHLLEQVQACHSYGSAVVGANNNQPLRSISQFMEFPKRIRITEGQEHQFLCKRMQNILILSNNLQQLISTYKTPQKQFDFIKYKFFQQKLYQVRFGYQRWNHVFQYEVHLIKNYGYVLECALIKKNRSQQNNLAVQAQPLNGKYVMFCNPNGVYIQFFAVENTYIQEYLRKGYQVILWNYRGYGQSTGSPTIAKSQSDAMKVYNYFTEKGMKIEVVHGYSIGGCAAIGLVHKLQKRQKQRQKSGRHPVPAALRNQNLSNNIKLLIVDRSFSSIGDMAIQFGPSLHKLAKIVFTFDNVNLSQLFAGLKTQKILLWDKKDEVIPDSASVKGGILMSTLGIYQQSSCKSCSNCMKHEQQNALNEEVSVLINQRDQQNFQQINKRFVHRFISALKTLLKYSCEIQKTGDIQLNTNHEYDPSQLALQQNYDQKSNQNLNLTEQIVNQVLTSLQFVDGGGSFLPSPLPALRKALKSNPLSFDFKCKSYIVGLAYYGSVLPMDVAFKSKSQIQLHTLKKIDDVIRNFNKIIDQVNQMSKIMDAQFSTALDDIRKTFVEVRGVVESNFLSVQSNKFGKLISLNSGHNGSLPQDQLSMLMNYIRQVCTHNQVSSNGLGSQSRLQQDNSANRMHSKMGQHSNIQNNTMQRESQSPQMTLNHSIIQNNSHQQQGHAFLE